MAGLNLGVDQSGWGMPSLNGLYPSNGVGPSAQSGTDLAARARANGKTPQQQQDDETHAAQVQAQAQINAATAVSHPPSSPLQQSSPSSYLGLNTAAQAEPMVAPTPNSAGSGPISQGTYDQEHAQAAAATAELAASQKLQEASAAAKRGDMELAARLQAEAEQRRLGYLSTVVNTAQGSTPMVSRGNLATDEAGARSAAFARAKEQAGTTALSSIQALKDVMAGSGKMGSSQEAQGIANVVSGGASMVNDYTRDQLMLDLNRAADISDQTYQGNIAQRGQNMGMIPSLMALLSASGTAY